MKDLDRRLRLHSGGGGRGGALVLQYHNARSTVSRKPPSGLTGVRELASESKIITVLLSTIAIPEVSPARVLRVLGRAAMTVARIEVQQQ